MERAIDCVLARALLEGRLASGATVRLDAGEGGLALEDAECARPAMSSHRQEGTRSEGE